ncbi:hypothetical protein RUE5091_01801 [Ruegeria denitrificans]|uniref:Uncharacterized protein n=1 Tax=Ruegeria denitrificans TaxID=1715692 RepID=A0A0P1I8D0_9RHOB|nr:hypothetical protein [Ruegeria denitrificans]CUJ97412.1 hypothetical protein RUE5091_01801 [Ruegeria denitrificans]
MTHPTLTPIRFENGLWQGYLQAETQVEVLYLGEPLKDVQVKPSDNGWTLTVPVPVVALSDGVHSFVIVDTVTSEKLGDFTIIAGVPAADDLRAEVELLRAELDMLKRAFRRAQSTDE